MVQRVEAWGNLLEFPDDMSHDDMAKIIRKNEATLNPDYKPKDIGFLGTLKEGAKGTLRNLGATVGTLQGDEGEVVSASRAATEAPKDPALTALMQDIDRRKKALGDNPGWIDAIKTVGGAALSNPKGAGLLLAEQLPNSAAALAASGAGALAGSAFGPVGTIAGGLAGLFGANTALETGGKAMEAATDGTFSPEEQGRVLKEGAIKGGVITGIDAATLGLTNFITGTTRRAVERATAKVLADHGVDVSNKAAVTAAAKNPAISESVKAAQELAEKASTTLGKRVARVGGATGLETVGEGAGEYLGEMAATGKADKVDAVIEALSSLGQSAGEIAFTAAKNKAKLETILGKPVDEVSDRVLRYTTARGGERAKAAAQAELNRRAAEGVDPEVANAPESTSEAVDRIIATGREKADEIRSARADAIQDSIFDEEPENALDNAPAAQSQPAPDAPTPEPIQTLNAQINALSEGRKPGVLLTPNEPMPDALPEGVQAAEIPGRGILLYRDEAALRDALEGRMGKALGYGIDEKPADATHVVTARDANGTVIQDVATDGRLEVEQAATAVAGQNGTVETRPIQEAMSERGVNSGDFDGIKTQLGPTPEANVDEPLTQKTTDLVPASQDLVNRPAQQPSSREAGTTNASNATQVTHPIRPLIESLIKRRAAAKQSGKERAVNNAIARAKEVMEGKRADAALESKWFRVQAAGMKKADAETAEILKQIGEAVKSKEVRDDEARFSRASEPSTFVNAPDGDTDFGQITKEIGSKIKRQSAPIRLVHGEHRADGSGYGLVHIEANHGKQIRNAGFDSVEAFVAHVAKNFNEILRASGRQLLVAVENGRKDVMFVQLEPSENGDYYRINTAFPTSRDYLEKQIRKGMVVLWSGSEPALAVTGKQPAYAANPETGSSQDDPIARGQSDPNISDEGVKFNRENIAEVRKRLKTASNKAKQATRRGGLSVSEVEKLIAPLQQAGFKKINIAATQNDLPQKIRNQIKSQKAGAVRGAYIPSTDEIWLVADQLNDALDVALVAMHEARHRGLRKMFGPGIAPIMRQIYATNKRVRDLADRKIKAGMSKELAVEETLADLPLDRVRALNGWKKLINFIKQWITEKFDLTFTDAMVEQLVAGAEIVGMSEDEVSLFDESKVEAIRDASNGTMFSRKPSHNNDSDEFYEAAGRAIKENADKNRRFREEHITLWDKSKKWLKRQLSPGGLLPQSVFAEKLSRDNEFAAIEFDVAHLVGKLEKAIKADYGISAINLDAKVQSLLSEVMAGKIDKDVPESTKTALIGMRQYIDSLSMRYVESLREQAIEQVAMAELTGDKDLIAKAEENARLQVTIMGNIGEYVHRSYRAFDDPNWAKKIPDQVINDARDYLIERNLETMGKAEAERKAEIILNEIVKHGTAYDSMAAFIKESKLGAKDLSILQRRKVIAPEIRALLGEYTDPRINFAKSATKMGRLIFNQKFLENIRKMGFGEFMFTDENKPPEATAKIAADSSEVLAPLNGLWVTPEVDQAFRDALGKEHMEDWYRKIVQINGMVKYGKTVLSPTTAARNWMSAFFFAVANGHFDLRHMAKSVDGLKEYFAHGGDARKMAYLRELKQLGVVYDTPYAGEMMRLLADTNIADTLILGKKKLNIKNAFAMATKFYQYGDDFWKIIGFENEKQMWMKTGLSEQEAKVKAAERIRNTYPTYSMVGRGIQALRRFPLAGTFVSFPAEIVRTSANMLKYLSDDYKNPKTRSMAVRRGIGLAITSSFAFAAHALSMAMLGFDDEDDEAVRSMAAPWQRNSNLLYTGRDGSGNIRYMDMSFLDPYNYWKRPIIAVLRDQPANDSLRDILSETLAPFFGTDILAGTIFEVMANKKETGAPVFKSHDDPVNQIVDIANHIRKTIQPGIFNNMERTYKALDGEVTRSGKKYDPQDEAAAWFGFRMSTLDPKVSLFYRSFDFKDAKSEAEKKLRDVALNPNEIGKNELRDTYDEATRIREKAFGDMSRLVNAAMRSGMSRGQVIGTLRNGGISIRDAMSIANGRVPKWQIPQSAGDQARKTGSSLGPEAGRRVMERYRELSGIAAEHP